jgi:hypothetical protein
VLLFAPNPPNPDPGAGFDVWPKLLPKPPNEAMVARKRFDSALSSSKFVLLRATMVEAHFNQLIADDQD